MQLEEDNSSIGHKREGGRVDTVITNPNRGRIQGLVWTHQCYGNVGFVSTNNTL